MSRHAGERPPARHARRRVITMDRPGRAIAIAVQTAETAMSPALEQAGAESLRRRRFQRRADASQVQATNVWPSRLLAAECAGLPPRHLPGHPTASRVSSPLSTTKRNLFWGKKRPIAQQLKRAGCGEERESADR